MKAGRILTWGGLSRASIPCTLGPHQGTGDQADFLGPEAGELQACVGTWQCRGGGAQWVPGWGPHMRNTSVLCRGPCFIVLSNGV